MKMAQRCACSHQLIIKGALAEAFHLPFRSRDNITWHAYNYCSTAYTRIHSPTHPPQTTQLCQYLLCFCRLVPVHPNSNQSLPARDARSIQPWNHHGEPAGSPSKQQSDKHLHICLTLPLLFQNKVLKQQGKGLVNGSINVPRNHQPRCFQLCSHCCNQWMHLAVMSTYWQENNTPSFMPWLLSSSRPTNGPRPLTALGGKALRGLVLN